MRSISSAVAEEVILHQRVAVVLDDAADRTIYARLLAHVVLDGVVLQRAETMGAEQPDAVILIADFSAPSGLAALRRIRKDAPAVPVVVVSHGDAIGAREALNAGADAYVRAELLERTLAPALGAAMAGFVCAPREVRRLVAKPTFSHREKQVIELLVAGLTNAQIAARLYLAESTVKSHVASVFAKLGVRSRKDAATLLLDPAEGLTSIALPPRPD